MKVSSARKPLLLFQNGAGLDDHICKAAMSAPPHARAQSRTTSA